MIEHEMNESQDSGSGVNYKTYKSTGIYGRDDLWSLSPWSNSEWPTWSAKFNYTEEEYNRNPKAYEERIKERNDAHIEMLKQNGQYGKEYHRYITIRHYPVFDDPQTGNFGQYGMFFPKGMQE